MEVKQNINFYRQSHCNLPCKNYKQPVFQGRLPLNNGVCDVFIKKNSSEIKYSQSLWKNIKETYIIIKSLANKKKNTLNFAQFENKDTIPELQKAGTALLFERGFGDYLYTKGNPENFLKILEESRMLSLENTPSLKNYRVNSIYDYPIKFAIAVLNSFQKNGNATIIEKIPPVFEGLKKEELVSKLDIIASLLNEFPHSDKEVRFFKIEGKNFYSKFIGSGGYGRVYEIRDLKRKKPPIAIKIFHDPYEVSCHGIFSEIGIYKELGSQNLKDIPEFYMANPVGDAASGQRGKVGWMITDFIEKNTPLKKNSTQSFEEFIKKYALKDEDNHEKNRISGYKIDLGGIVGSEYENNRLIRYGAGKEISLVLKGMRKGETVQDIISAMKKRLHMS